MNKHHIWASAFAMLALTYGGKLSAQGRLDLAGQWEFQIDRADKGTADKWYDRPLEDRILLPGSMPQRLKVTGRRWKRSGQGRSTIVPIFL